MPVRQAPIAEFCAEIKSWVINRERHWVVTLNLDYVARLTRDQDFKQLLQNADVFTADGAPVLWACRQLDSSFRKMVRTTGADLTPELLRMNDASSIAIVGGVDPKRALIKLGLNPCSYFIFDGIVQFEDAWAKNLAVQIGKRNLVFVALGVPKQEQMISLLRPHLPDAVFVAVGGSFELIAGITKRAPVWMQRAGMEWLFRLAIEPRRLWRRYLVEYPAGAWALYKFVKAAKRTASKTLPPA